VQQNKNKNLRAKDEKAHARKLLIFDSHGS